MRNRGRRLLLAFCVGVLAATVSAACAQEPAAPQHKSAYAQEYYHSFKRDQEIGPEFHWHGLDPQSCVVFEPTGLRITLPDGHPGKRMGTGIGISTPVKGDFEITLSYEMIKEPQLAGAVHSTGLFVWVDLNKPNLNRGFVSRMTRPDKQFVVWYHLSAEGAGKPVDESRYFPAKDSHGRLRLVRTGAVLFHYVADGDRADFTLLEQHPFGTEDLQAIRWGGQTGGIQASLEGRFLDLRIRADALPELPTTGPDAAPGQALVPPVAKGSDAGWLAAGLGLGLAALLATALGVALLLYLRRRPEAPADAESRPAPAPVSLPCPECGKRIKVGSALAGRKVKCPQCGKAVSAPGIDHDKSSNAAP